MEIRLFPKLPVYAVDIRNAVFVKEQGFKEEFDEEDKKALHLVGFINDKNVATSRIIKRDDGSFIIGRIAVRKDFRKMGLGAEIIKFSEDTISELGGKTVYIHAQMQAVPFYEKQGYRPIGEGDFDEGCPHQMMIKEL